MGDLSPVSYTYDAASRLRTITQAPLNPASIDYDTLGRRTNLTLPNGVSTEYQYDAASRLTALIYRNAAGLLGDLTYTYDPAGNRIGVGGLFARTLLPDSITAGTYDPANRQQSFGDKTMTYDANGNLTSITDPNGLATFTWDARNRLVGLAGPGRDCQLCLRRLRASGRQADQRLGHPISVRWPRHHAGGTSQRSHLLSAHPHHR
ncbi:MAG: hypothetical protein M5R38_01650 [Candidatus Methylomirabilis sp.]|nr:hypothetical protein [Candidatus Methylomirabilis sp.]